MNLYTFTPLNETPVRMTTAKATITVNSVDYLPRSLKRYGYAVDSLSRKNNFTVTFPGNDQFARRFLLPNRTILNLVVATLTGEVIFRGNLISVQYDTKMNTVGLIFEPVIRLDRRATGERRMYQIDCPYSLYDSNCGATERTLTVSIHAIRSDRVVQLRYPTARTTLAQIIPTQTGTGDYGSPQMLIGGTLVTPKGRFWVINVTDFTSDGTAVYFDTTLFRVQQGLAVNDSCTISLGCRRIPPDCRFRFNNFERYGGFYSMTKESPFEGGLQ